jgi:putative hydrolase of the HAD superfamily
LDAVVFDLGQVLIEVRVERAYREVARLTGLPALDVCLRLSRGGELYRSFETAGVSVSEFHEQLCALLGAPLSFKDFETAWNSVLVDEIVPTAELVRGMLRDGRVRLAVLSNTNAPHVAHMRRTWPLLGEFEHVYMSNEIGARKPDHAAYRYVLNKLAVSPERTVMVDDRRENIDAAEALGMTGVWATSPRAVREGLSDVGVL